MPTGATETIQPVEAHGWGPVPSGARRTLRAPVRTSMSRTLKLLVTGLVTLLALTTAALPAHATTDAARSGARWVAAQTPADAKAGGAADALIALAAGQDPTTAEEAPRLLEIVRTQGASYVADGAEGAAKLVIALDAVGEDPRTFLPDLDLVAEVKAGVQADGSFGAWPGPFASGLGATALARVGEPVPAELITNLTTYRNGDGGFGFAPGGPSDADSTALAILALLAANETDQLAEAIDWAGSTQSGDGSWAGYSPVNSTAILGASLATAGEPVDKALSYLSTQQQASGDFLTSEGKSDPLATTQAVLLLAGVSYLDVTWDVAGSSSAAPVATTPGGALQQTGPDLAPWFIAAAVLLALVGAGLLLARRYAR